VVGGIGRERQYVCDSPSKWTGGNRGPQRGVVTSTGSSEESTYCGLSWFSNQLFDRGKRPEKHQGNDYHKNLARPLQTWIALRRNVQKKRGLISTTRWSIWHQTAKVMKRRRYALKHERLRSGMSRNLGGGGQTFCTRNHTGVAVASRKGRNKGGVRARAMKKP